MGDERVGGEALVLPHLRQGREGRLTLGHSSVLSLETDGGRLVDRSHDTMLLVEACQPGPESLPGDFYHIAHLATCAARAPGAQYDHQPPSLLRRRPSASPTASRRLA